MQNNHATLRDKIEALRRERNAVLLAHNYQPGEIQDIADFVGDSLGLVQKAIASDADIIVMCGVLFMAETAAIMMPERTVLLPDPTAGCPMSNMITAEELLEKKQECPKATVVCYLNTPAEVKAESDICCTADNAVKVVQSLPKTQEVVFVPDLYLGDYISTQTGRELDLWPGYCPTHSKIMPEDITRHKADYPEAKVVAHPECSPLVRGLADVVANSGGIVSYARQTEAREIIVATEVGILHRLRKENPSKTFIAASEKAVCGKMKRTTLETVYWALEDKSTRIEVPADIRIRAKRAIDRMFEIEGVNGDSKAGGGC